MTLRVGLTGGIGSGKSTVANYFAALGVPIIDADQIAHEITKKDKASIRIIADHFGADIIAPDGSLQRNKLRQIIFNNKDERLWLEQLLHPLIRKAMFEQMQTCHYPYCILVIPLLAESNEIDFIDRVLVVDAPLELRKQRAQQRDDTTNEDIEKIIRSQSNHQQRLSIADDVITNDADLQALKNKVFALHQNYLNLAKKG